MTAIFELVWRIVWTENTSAGQMIVAVTLVVAAVATLCALWHLARYKGRERRWLHIVRNRLAEALATRAMPPERATKEPRSLVDLAKLSENVPERTLIGDRIATIRRIMKARVKVSIDALQQMTMLRESGRVTLMLPSFVAGLCMLLGLLGTFFGLSLLVKDLQGAMPSAQAEVSGELWAQSMKRFGTVLEGKRTAFSCTLVGLFCSIALSGFNFVLARVQSAFYDRLERFTIEELLPETVPSVEGETALERFALQMGESFERIEALTNGQIETLTQVRAIEGNFRKLIDGVREAVAQSNERQSQKTIGESAAVHELTRVSQSVVALADKLTAALSQAKQSDKQPLRELAAAVREQQAQLERILTRATDARAAAPIGQTSMWTPKSAVAVAAMVGAIVLLVHTLW